MDRRSWTGQCKVKSPTLRPNTCIQLLTVVGTVGCKIAFPFTLCILEVVGVGLEVVLTVLEAVLKVLKVVLHMVEIVNGVRCVLRVMLFMLFSAPLCMLLCILDAVEGELRFA